MLAEVVKDNKESIRSYTQHSALSLMDSTTTINFKPARLGCNH